MLNMWNIIQISVSTDIRVRCESQTVQQGISRDKPCSRGSVAKAVEFEQSRDYHSSEKSFQYGDAIMRYLFRS